MSVISLLALLAVGCAPPTHDTGEDSAAAASAAAASKLPIGLWERVEAGTPTVILVQLAEDDLRPAFSDLPRWERRQRRADLYGRRMDAVLNDLPVRGVRLLKRYEQVPMLPLEVEDVDALAALEADGRVVRVYEEEHHEAFLSQSLDLIDQPTAEADGFTGEGYAVAVLDTGLDYTRTAFGSCTTPGEGGSCRVVYATDFATSDGARDTGNYHGTNVAGIVAGVAPEADLIGLDVFVGSSASSTDIIEAIDWAIVNVDTYNIAALNLSLGGGAYAAACSGSVYSSAFSNARAEGIIPVAASGNNGYTSKMSAPACDPLALSVGAVYDSNVGRVAWSSCTDATSAADKVTCFSNSASFLDILAPGALIDAAELVMGGTSQAAPHVAGAVAVVRAAFPGDSADELQARLTSNGVPVTDARQGRVTPRLDLPLALGGWTDGIGPTGTISINGGAASTNSSTLTASLSSSTATAFCVSDTATDCTTWETYADTKSISISGATRTITLHARFKDAEGDISETASDSILFDITAPTNGTLSAIAGEEEIALSWSGFSDSDAGIASYMLVYTTNGDPSSECSDGTMAYLGSDTSVTLSDLSADTAYSLRLCAIDGAGNLSTGAQASATPEAPPLPTSLEINGGAEWTASRSATLTLSSPDATQMCISNATTCSAWQTFATTKTWSLASGTGTKTVRAWFKDASGTITSPVSDTIGVDTTKPTNGTLSGEGGDGSLDLSWTNFKDTQSGLGSYTLVYSTTTSPASGCTNGTVAYTGTATEVMLTGLTNGSTYNLRVCALDTAGNTSTGATLSLRPAPEYDAPTGSVTINAGNDWTGSVSATLTLSGSDASAVSQMCISNTTTCSAWQTFATTKTWSLASGTGTKTVRVWLKDTYGNVSAVLSDTIGLDATKPASGTLLGTASMGQIDLSWSGASDTHTSVASYKIVYKTGTAKPASSCTSGTVLYEGANTSTIHNSVVAGTTYNYRLCAVDAVGNVGTGYALTVKP